MCSTSTPIRRKPKLVKTITDFAARTGLVGPHTYYAMPGRMLIGALSNSKDHGGATGMAMYNNKGDFISKYDMPTAKGGDGYGYDIAINPAKNAMLTSSFTGWNNYMMDLGKLMKDRLGDEALRHHHGDVEPEVDASPKRCSTCPARRSRSAGR